MAKTQPKRTATKTPAKKQRKIDWTRVALIVIGLMIVISMVLSMFQGF